VCKTCCSAQPGKSSRPTATQHNQAEGCFLKPCKNDVCLCTLHHQNTHRLYIYQLPHL
jgi:hypothetical protein